jgi:hypothetical protein
MGRKRWAKPHHSFCNHDWLKAMERNLIYPTYAEANVGHPLNTRRIPVDSVQHPASCGRLITSLPRRAPSSGSRTTC